MQDLDVLINYQKSELENTQGLLTDFYAGERDFEAENDKPIRLHTWFFKTVKVAQIHVYQAEENPAEWVRVADREYKLEYGSQAEGGHNYAILSFDRYVEDVVFELVDVKERVRAVRFLGDLLINESVESTPGEDWRDQVKFE